MDRAGDRGGVATDLGAVAVQQGAAADDVVDVSAGDVPHVGVLGNHAQRRRGASADHDRRVGLLDRFGVAECPGQLDVGAVEVERLGLGPQPPDDGARLGEASHRVGEVVEGQAVRRVLTPGRGWSDVSPRRYRSRAARRRRRRRSRRSWPASRADGSGCWSRARPDAAARVCAARAESSVQPSKVGPSGSPPIGMRWSNSHACSISSMASASCQTRRMLW